MSTLLTADEAARLHVGVNVIVRPGDRKCEWWRWDGCQSDTGKCEWTECPVVAPQDWVALTALSPDYRRVGPLFATDGNSQISLVGRGSIEVVPVVGWCGGAKAPRPFIEVPHDDAGNVLLWRVDPDSALYSERATVLPLDPLPVPGRDFGVVIDCVEVAA